MRIRTLFLPFWGCGLAAVVFLFSSLPLCGAVPGDEHWDAQFGWPGPGGFILAATTHNGRLYVSGTGGSGTNTTVQIWDGAQWSTIGRFSGPPTTVIYDLAFVGDTLYAGGVFTNVDGVAASCLARWDGNAWTGVSLNAAVYALAVDGGNLYAGGYFTTNADGLEMKRIGRWDGSTWSALGSGLGTNYDQVWALAATNGIVYAGGYFTNAGSLLVSNVARWDGASWSALSNGLNSGVSSLLVNGSDLYAGGYFGTSPYSAVSRWNGTNWSLVGSGFNNGAQSMAIFNNLLCVAGSFTNIGGVQAKRFATWNGTSWAAAGDGLSAQGGRVCPNGTNLYVGGTFLSAGGHLANGLASWDGANWSVLGTPDRCNGIYTTARAMAGDGTNLYAGGASFNWAGQTNVNLIGRWDGTHWFPLGAGIKGSGVISGPISTAILTLALTNNYLYAGGYFTNAGGVTAKNIAMWNGSNWSALGSGPGGAVAAILVRPDGVYAVGAPFYNVSLFGSPFFSRWDGVNWQGVAINYPPYTDTAFYFADPNFGMAALAAIGTNIFIGGHFSIGEYASTNPPSGYTNCNNIMRFDGTYGWIMGTGLNSNVTTMVVMGTNLYVAGQFTNAGGVAASKIAMWNGSRWTNLSSGVVGSGVINGLATVGGNLYAGGTFTNMGGTTVHRIAKWNGTNWTALGNGFINPDSASASVSGLGFSGNNLFASGSFRMAGDKPSFYIGRWNESANFNTPQLANPAWLTNRQFQVRLMGISGLTNIIQATTNFTTWTPVLTNGTGIYDFTDANSAAYPRRFYRAVLGP